MKTHTMPRHELAYRRNLDACLCRVGRFSPAHVIVVDPTGRDHIEILTTSTPPRWLTDSAQLTRNEIEKTIRRSASITPQFKSVFLAMLATAKEVRS